MDDEGDFDIEDEMDVEDVNDVDDGDDVDDVDVEDDEGLSEEDQRIIDELKGEDDDEDDEDEEEDVEEEEEETEEEDEEEIEEDEELSGLLDVAEEQDSDETPHAPEDPDTITDDDIVTAMYRSKTYEGWLEAADEEGIRVDDRFAAVVARSRIEPDILTENGIFDMVTMVEHMSSLKGLVDPDRLVVPDTDDEKEWGAFLNEAFNVPLTAEGYKDDLFADTFMASEEMADMRDELRQDFKKGMFSEEQAYQFIDMVEKNRNNWLDEQREQEKQYIVEQEAALKKEFGEDWSSVQKDVAGMFRKYGPEFLKTATKKEQSSAHLIKMVQRMMSDTAAPERLQLRDAKAAIETLSDKGLDNQLNYWRDRYDTLGEKYDQNPTNKLQKSYSRAKIMYDRVMKEVDRRGLTEG